MDHLRHWLGIVSIILASISGSVAHAQDQPVIEEQVPLASRWILHSTVLGEDRPILVRLPDGYDPKTRRYPVIVVLDAEGLFIPVTAVAEMMPWAYRSPDLIVVGIPNTKRARDFTTPWTSKNNPSPIQRRYLPGGGADRFVDFLRTELLPEIDRRYATAPYRVLVGHSLSGLFALHAFSAAPGLFNATVAASPALSWNDDQVITDLDHGFRTTTAPKGFVFISRAETEFDDTPRAFGKLNELLRLRAPSSLQWRTQIIAGEDHGTGMLPAVQAGLEWAFVNWRLPSLVFDEGIDSVERFYVQLSKQYGFTILPPESELIPLAARDKERNLATALRDYRRYVALYPRSIDAHSGLADVLAASGDARGAAAAFDRAIQIATEEKDARLLDIQKRRVELSTVQSMSATRH